MLRRINQLLSSLLLFTLFNTTVVLAATPYDFVREVVKQNLDEKVLVLNAERELGHFIFEQRVQQEQQKKRQGYWNVETMEQKSQSSVGTIIRSESGFSSAKADEDQEFNRLRVDTNSQAHLIVQKVFHLMQKRFCPKGGSLPPEALNNLQDYVEQMLEIVTGMLDLNSPISLMARETAIRVASYLVAVVVQAGVSKFCSMSYPSSL
jgi:hypothetical protein